MFKINPAHSETLMQQLKGVDHSSFLKDKHSLRYLALAWDSGAGPLFLALLSVFPVHSSPVCKYRHLSPSGELCIEESHGRAVGTEPAGGQKNL